MRDGRGGFGGATGDLLATEPPGGGRRYTGRRRGACQGIDDARGPTAEVASAERERADRCRTAAPAAYLNHEGLESAKPDLQSLFKKPGA